MKFFNTAGPINPENHYYISHRLNEQEICILIEQEKYFILHAPRQTGKTTAIIQFVKQLNAEGNYKAIYINVESAQAARNKVQEGLLSILVELKNAIAYYSGAEESIIGKLHEIIEKGRINLSSLGDFLRLWSSESPQPIVLFIDEIDSLVGDTLISVLRQLRSGYPGRPNLFPQSVCLVGVRDVRDYRIWSEEGRDMILGGSAFNIKAESFRLADFSKDQVSELYNQHTRETGQQFTNEAIEYAFYLTQGQPWLVNALAYQVCFKDVQDRAKPITKEIIEKAKETLILRRDTHIDVLIDRLAEPRVRMIVDAILSGYDVPENFPIDDISYCLDLGLIARRDKKLEIANPIYKEIIPRELSFGTQNSITQETSWYQNPDGSLNMHKLLEVFQQFYRENSAIWLEQFAYKESGPHLLLMAFLQRVINGGGSIHREYALGRRRVDLLVCWHRQRIVIELKVMRNDKTILDGLHQTAEYMDINNATEGHLVIFDREIAKPWDEKIYKSTENVQGRTINVWGM